MEASQDDTFIDSLKSTNKSTVEQPKITQGAVQKLDISEQIIAQKSDSVVSLTAPITPIINSAPAQDQNQNNHEQDEQQAQQSQGSENNQNCDQIIAATMVQQMTYSKGSSTYGAESGGQFHASSDDKKNKTKIIISADQNEETKQVQHNVNEFEEEYGSQEEEGEESYEEQMSTQEKAFKDKMNSEEELAYEQKYLEVLKKRDWRGVEDIARQQMTTNPSYKALYYYGIAMYKQEQYRMAYKSFKKAEQQFDRDSQLQYSLGLLCFKLEYYEQSIQHYRRCVEINPNHVHAYNNLAYIFNLNQLYRETISICKEAKEHNGKGKHMTHRHWAYAEFKEGNMVNAVKKIRKSVQKDQDNADNWVVWGLILRSAGKYVGARHKFMKALKIDGNNKTAQYELRMISDLIKYETKMTEESWF